MNLLLNAFEYLKIIWAAFALLKSVCGVLNDSGTALNCGNLLDRFPVPDE